MDVTSVDFVDPSNNPPIYTIIGKKLLILLFMTKITEVLAGFDVSQTFVNCQQRQLSTDSNSFIVAFWTLKCLQL